MSAAASTQTRSSEVRPGARQDDLIYDVGMNEGVDTAFYLKKGFRVVAVEANPAACRTAAGQFAAEIASGRLVIVNRAVADADRPIDFHVCATLPAWSTASDRLRREWEGRGAVFETVQVQTCRAEDLLETHGVPYYAKIDIEGSDLVCLKGFAAAAQRPRYVSVEVDFYAVDELIRSAAGLGYRRFALVGQSGIGGLAARAPALEGRTVAHQFSACSSGPFGRELDAEWLGMAEVRAACRRVIAQHRGAGILRRLRKLAPAQGVERLSRAWFPLAADWYDLHAGL